MKIKCLKIKHKVIVDANNVFRSIGVRSPPPHCTHSEKGLILDCNVEISDLVYFNLQKREKT
jgi:hypothetical protein